MAVPGNPTSATPRCKAPVNLLGLPQEKLERFFADLGEPRYRARQVMQWIHQRGVTDFQRMTDLSKPLRARLAQVAEVRPPRREAEQISADGTRKWLVRLDDGEAVEMVWIPDDGRGTLCVSSQVGCALDCSFCATGKQGFNRNLSAAEIVGQLWLALDAFGKFGPRPDRPVTNVVLMGMGEPLLNFENVVDALSLMLHDWAYGLSKRRVTLSTAGLVPQIDALGDRVDVSLAISLHAPNDPLRDRLVPLNRKYPLSELIAAARRYLAKMPDQHRRITVEYTLIEDVNDHPGHARQLAALLRELPCKINLIPFNPFPGSHYRRVSDEALERFRTLLLREGYTVTVRTPRGGRHRRRLRPTRGALPRSDATKGTP
ncbi:MAG: dual-specificity RNA methyltransferase RlmN [Porticoccaceae bacterium]|nr:MAG: dual-specificity RNA methyltransferase RlmN [Porticoccaceae bacterium]